MDIIHLPPWLILGLVVWTMISLVAAHFVGPFLSGFLHERDTPPPERVRPEAMDGLGQPLNGPFAAPPRQG